MMAELFFKKESTLAEGPVWDQEANCLLWVDIEEMTIHFLEPDQGHYQVIRLQNKVGTAIPTTTGNIVCAADIGVFLINRNGKFLSTISGVEADIPTNRFNDGKCDSMGRLWAGTMDINSTPGNGGLYCITGNGIAMKRLENVTISNGMAWSADSLKFYFIDTPLSAVFQFDFDPFEGTISNLKRIITIPKEMGFPDGMTIDENGNLWIAHWGGGCVSNWDPGKSRLMGVYPVPAWNVTSCTFGGSNLDTLLITTARLGLNKNQLEEYPLSGSIFALRPGTRGREAHFFREK